MADLEKRSKGYTPLLCAAAGQLWPLNDIYALRSKQREQTIRILIQAGANVRVERQAMHGVPFKSVLGSAIKWGSGDIIRFLVEKGPIYMKNGHMKTTQSGHIA